MGIASSAPESCIKGSPVKIQFCNCVHAKLSVYERVSPAQLHKPQPFSTHVHREITLTSAAGKSTVEEADVNVSMKQGRL